MPNTMNKTIGDYSNELEKEYINIYREITLIANYKNDKSVANLEALKSLADWTNALDQLIVASTTAVQNG